MIFFHREVLIELSNIFFCIPFPLPPFLLLLIRLIRCKKYYVLHYKASETQQSRTFGALPFISLMCGVFVSKAQARAYQELFPDADPDLYHPLWYVYILQLSVAKWPSWLSQIPPFLWQIKYLFSYPPPSNDSIVNRPYRRIVAFCCLWQGRLHDFFVECGPIIARASIVLLARASRWVTEIFFFFWRGGCDEACSLN